MLTAQRFFNKPFFGTLTELDRTHNVARFVCTTMAKAIDMLCSSPTCHPSFVFWGGRPMEQYLDLCGKASLMVIYAHASFHLLV